MNLAAIEARIKLGLTVRTAANELAARREIGKYLKARGVRITHIQQVLPLALELSFTPTRYEVSAAAFRNCADVVHRHEELRAELDPNGSTSDSWWA
jgi:hypothetical protein